MTDPSTHPPTEAERRVERWNASVLVGAPCHWWTHMDRSGEKRTSATRSKAWVLSSGDPVVLVEGLAGGLHLDCVEPLPVPVYDLGFGAAVESYTIDAPPTEAVGEVRRELLAVRLECIETTLNDDGTARLQRGELIAGEGRFLGEVLCTPDEYVALYTALTAAEKLRAEVERLRARIHEAVDKCQRRYGPVESQLAKCRGLMREALRRHDETSGHPPGTHISGYGQAAAAAILEERDQARSDLAAMTSDRDWLRGEFEKATAEIERLHHALIWRGNRCRTCGGKEPNHHMWCALYEGPVTHEWVKQLWNDFHKEWRHLCSCGAEKSDELSTDPGPCPRAGETWRGTKPEETT